MKQISTLLCLLLLLTACNNQEYGPSEKNNSSKTSYVNTFIGTGGHGHTYPGATMPFGMMQLSPDTRLEGWDGCSGYHYSDSYIYGFSHTHLSGTGVSDYGDILLMPTNKINFNNGADGKKGYRAHFSHENESASPGYYQVKLDSTNIEVELTVTPRAGMHKYVFPSSEDQVVILDLDHRDYVLETSWSEVSTTEIEGKRFSKAWAEKQMLFYNLKTSHPFEIRSSDAVGRNAIALVLDNPNNEPVYISVGISAVDEVGARNNREAEIGSKTFAEIRREANQAWEQQLRKIDIESPNEDYKTNFYSALYHTMIAPNLYQDVDGRYRGMDLEIHQTTNFNYYTVFSLWDTYRAAHPLYTIIEQQRTNDFINTFLAKYDEGGIMPIWDLSANYTGCMIGYHGVPVIADAYLKGIDGYDAEKAFAAMKHSAMQDKLGLEAYKSIGFVPVEEESESVSKTLEYAYDDWTIAAMAKKMGKTDDYKLFSERAQYYKNVFDPETGFMRGRFNNTWFAPFDPYEVNFNYTEANAWQYSLYVPQDITGLTKIMGGKQKLEEHLDRLFSAKTETSGRDQSDITGLIGQYAHGNEPSHHMAYLYNFVNKPAKTQALIRQVLTELYTNEPDGISGNEDCGQMSAWYVFSSLGFYPVTPGTNQYIIGSPLFPSATINLENGKKFTVEAKAISEANKYISEAFLNGKALNRTYLTHEEIMAGGTLTFSMTATPSSWGTEAGFEPKTEIKEHQILLSPFLAKGESAFKEQTEVALGIATSETEIFYSLNNAPFKLYSEPFIISEATTLKTYAADGYGRESKILSTKFFKIDPNLSITLATEYANQYNAGGNDALIDGIRGAKDFRTGAWQGYFGEDLVAIVDLGSEKPVDEIKINFLQDQGSWIFFPSEVDAFISTSKDFKNSLATVKMDNSQPSEEAEIKTIQFDGKGKRARYVKIVAKNFGSLPNWHLGYPDGVAWIFADEITIK